ncbi:TetR/AcrR family transcriptional regulator [Reinekea marinisedimentorum]|uniref:AcrR family transcriptional regulator n=1 Tax=Reinekea marinisedimentorum TaxID=230495 RepID=A0A4R3ICX3_9GAMM|nr:TetR/AcrR family transcriptional regulator [Reinekea marinisedimentorum]TCS43664.1 AcrR family transcriptional regulator [Reinekea marinisedimentorum]
MRFKTEMAQNSKKLQIAESALPLFLENGIKGTSVDMVVKASGVSKPTVYNHFPDKSSLLHYTLQCWLEDQPKPTFDAADEDTLLSQIENQWLTTAATRLYGLFMGEGNRAPEARELFSTVYDQTRRELLAAWAAAHNQPNEGWQATVSHLIFNRTLYA